MWEVIFRVSVNHHLQGTASGTSSWRRSLVFSLKWSTNLTVRGCFSCGNLKLRALIWNPATWVQFFPFFFFLIHKGFFESNNSYFMMLAHDSRGGCWWYGSRGWTFPTIFCYMLLLCDRWQVWYLTWKLCEAKGWDWIIPKLHPLTFIDTCWMLMETKQWIWAQWGGAWWVSAVLTVIVVIAAAADIYEHGTQTLVHCWQKCIGNRGDYVKNSVFFLYQIVLLCFLYLLWFPWK